VLTALASDAPAELMIAGPRGDLAGLADLLRSGHGEARTAADLDPAPYGACLEGITVGTAGGAVRFFVDWPRKALSVQGDLASLGVLADNVDDIARESPAGTHHHFEFFPGHFYMGEGSAPLVVEVTD